MNPWMNGPDLVQEIIVQSQHLHFLQLIQSVILMIVNFQMVFLMVSRIKKKKTISFYTYITYILFFSNILYLKNIYFNRVVLLQRSQNEFPI